MNISEYRYCTKSGKSLEKRMDQYIVQGLSKTEAKKQVKENNNALDALQQRLFAQERESVLVVLQGMDTAGKDSLIHRVFGGLNPQGCRVASFKPPTDEEKKHDFLWRVHRQIPAHGEIVVFNRSHYEEVLIKRVHPALLLLDNLPEIREDSDADEGFWQRRLESICAFEQHLVSSGCHILKIFLNISRTEQKKRLLRRAENPEKQWKFDVQDIRERARWDDYQAAYRQAITATASEQCPWYVIPADDKWAARAAVSQILLTAMRGISPQFPAQSKSHLREIQQAADALRGE